MIINLTNECITGSLECLKMLVREERKTAM